MFYGVLTNNATLAYVIDGSFVQDVNAYPIQDIEEITLVQNALGQANGAIGAQQLILIKTRRNCQVETGIVVAGWAGLSFSLPQHTSIKWQTQLNATFISNSVKMNTYGVQSQMERSKTNPWTIGWVNRFGFKAFSAGLDLHAHFNQTQLVEYSSAGITVHKEHGLYIPNVYVGYQLKVKGLYPLDLFLHSQNLLYEQALLMNMRKYYAAGFKVAL